MSAIRKLIEKVRYGEGTDSHHLRLPNDHVNSSGSTQGPGETLSSGQHYFTVTVNGMHLDHERVGAKTYDPLVLAITEFLYDGEQRSLPFVVGAPLVKAAAPDGVPTGMGFADSLVAGPHPYYGRLAVTVILYRVERDDYVRRALHAIQRTCGAFDLSGTLAVYLKIGEAVLDGLDAALGQVPTQPVLGYRLGFGDEVRPGSFLVAPQALSQDELWLESGALRLGPDAEAAEEVAGMSYTAYTVAALPEFDLSRLPWFAPLWARITRWANIPNDDGKEMAKNYLAALYEEIALSPDVARDSVDTLYESWETRAHNIHGEARKRQSWHAEEESMDPIAQRALAIQASA